MVTSSRLGREASLRGRVPTRTVGEPGSWPAPAASPARLVLTRTLREPEPSSCVPARFATAPPYDRTRRRSSSGERDLAEQLAPVRVQKTRPARGDAGEERRRGRQSQALAPLDADHDLVITLAEGPRGTRSASVDFGGISRIAVPWPGDAGVLPLALPTMLASTGSAYDWAGHASLLLVMRAVPRTTSSASSVSGWLWSAA